MLVFSNSVCFTKENITPVEFNGEVIREIIDCSSPKGYPYLVKYTTASNRVDSFVTTSLPAAYKIPATQILFKISATVPGDELMFCNTAVLLPVQRSIYEIRLK